MIKSSEIKAKWLVLWLSVLAALSCQAAWAAPQAASGVPATSEKGKTSAVTIPSTNPDDVANKSRSWRKRKADLSKKDIQATKRAMKQQAISQGL
ncbi:hypothetical protein [Ferriphaselus sp. R-1]|uniref:hypothetical protein n=1 Tax=Ferriphaselus sp. R-1 TaxID=1485544 RepID=UPI0005594A49|nr:hypothetical protein [Ferriphaselus sp. R-1]